MLKSETLNLLGELNALANAEQIQQKMNCQKRCYGELP